VHFVLAAALLAAAGDSPHTLVRYSFDEHVDTGPDTFRVFQYSKGTVALASNARLSGWQSLEIRDVAGDGTFPELQGYFALRRHGRLYAHFAFLTTDVSQDLNIALAGPGHFALRKDGMAFWIAVKDGALVHYPATRTRGPVRLAGIGDCVPTRLLAVEPFLWYVVDLTYDVDAGTYDLVVQQEGRAEAVVRLEKQKNAVGQRASAVDKFSFIGDLEDAGSVTYYVDDIVIGTDERIRQLPFVAPGRRKLFVDRFADAERRTRERSCLPVLDPSDFGFTSADVAALSGAGLLGVLEALSDARVSPLPATTGLDEDTRRRLDAASHWASGCAALLGDPTRALAEFDRGAARAQEAPILAASSLLALARLGRWASIDERLPSVSAAWRDDPRYGVLLAQIGTARGALHEAEAWLRAPAESPRPEPFVASAYFYVLLSKGEATLAHDYAVRMALRLEERQELAATWLERAGDAAWRLGRVAEAKRLYERTWRASPNPAGVMLKLADVAWLEHDLPRERAYREAIYGRLRAKP
jgi:hypothetical protein